MVYSVLSNLLHEWNYALYDMQIVKSHTVPSLSAYWFGDFAYPVRVVAYKEIFKDQRLRGWKIAFNLPRLCYYEIDAS
jgi:hypothetical protein